MAWEHSELRRLIYYCKNAIKAPQPTILPQSGKGRSHQVPIFAMEKKHRVAEERLEHKKTVVDIQKQCVWAGFFLNGLCKKIPRAKVALDLVSDLKGNRLRTMWFILH